MSLHNQAAVVGIGETPTDRLGSKPGEPRKSTAQYLSWAMRLALEDAGLALKDFQGQGLGVTIPTAYPQPFWPEEAGEILGITPGFLLGGATGPIYPSMFGLVTQRFADRSAFAVSAVSSIGCGGSMLLPWLMGLTLPVGNGRLLAAVPVLLAIGMLTAYRLASPRAQTS